MNPGAERLAVRRRGTTIQFDATDQQTSRLPVGTAQIPKIIVCQGLFRLAADVISHDRRSRSAGAQVPLDEPERPGA